MTTMRKILTVAAAALAVAIAPAAAQAPPPARTPPPAQAPAPNPPFYAGGSAVLRGKILREEGKGGVPGAIVRIVHVETGQEYASAPTAGNGEFEIKDLPRGYYDVAVEVEDALYPASRVVSLSPGGRTVLELRIVPYDAHPASWWASTPKPAFPGAAAEPRGVAEVGRKLRGREFWRSPKGIAVITASGGAVLLGIAASAGGSSSNVVSPSTP